MATVAADEIEGVTIIRGSEEIREIRSISEVTSVEDEIIDTETEIDGQILNDKNKINIKYELIPELDPKVKRWIRGLRNTKMRPPAILSGAVVCHTGMYTFGMSIALITVFSTTSSIFYAFLTYNGYTMKYTPEQCGPFAKFFMEFWSKGVLENMAMSAVEPTTKNTIIAALFSGIRWTFNILYFCLATLQSILPDQMLVSIFPITAYMLEFFTLEGALAGWLLYNLLWLIDPNLGLIMLSFALIGSLSKMAKHKYFQHHSSVERDIKKSYYPRRSKPRGKIQVYANGYPILSLLFPVYYSYLVFPPHLGDSLVEYVNLVRYSQYEFLKIHPQLWGIFLISGLAKYLQGARDLIFTLLMEMKLGDVTNKFVAAIISRQVFIGLCAMMGDTLASDIGQMFTSFKVYAPFYPFNEVRLGTQGGISVPGTVMSIVGGGLLGAIQSLCYILSRNTSEFNMYNVKFGALCGFVGSYIDSILAWFFQPSAADIFGNIWDDGAASLCVGLKYLKALKPVGELGTNEKLLVDEVLLAHEHKDLIDLPDVSHPVFDDTTTTLADAMRYKLIHYSTLLKPGTIILDNSSVNFLAPLITCTFVNCFNFYQ